MNNHPDIDKIYLYAKDPYKAKKKKRLYYFNDPNVFIEYSNYMSDVYKNIEDYNPDKVLKINSF